MVSKADIALLAPAIASLYRGKEVDFASLTLILKAMIGEENQQMNLSEFTPEELTEIVFAFHTVKRQMADFAHLLGSFWPDEKYGKFTIIGNKNAIVVT